MVDLDSGGPGPWWIWTVVDQDSVSDAVITDLWTSIFTWNVNEEFISPSSILHLPETSHLSGKLKVSFPW